MTSYKFTTEQSRRHIKKGRRGSQTIAVAAYKVVSNGDSWSGFSPRSSRVPKSVVSKFPRRVFKVTRVAFRKRGETSTAGDTLDSGLVWSHFT